MTAHREYRARLPSLNLIFGRTPEMQAVRRKLESVSNTQLPVLVQGESGTGKEMCVQLIHELSGKGAGALIKVSCPAIPHSLVETELFGYEKGAFTGATSTKRGRVEEADGGTLFLDEVGSLDLEVQSKMLQLLQDGSFMRVGGHSMRTIKTRLISVANRDLKEQVDEGSFRLDLLYRINVMTIDLPPLRRRREDIPELVDYFIEQHARTFQVTPVPLSHDAMRMMQRYDWPGNIRQLDNLIRGYVLIGNEEALVAEMMPEEKASENVMAKVDLTQPISIKEVTKRATQDLERQIIMKVLRANGWNRQKTAKFLKMSYRSLLYKIREAESVEESLARRTTLPPKKTKTDVFPATLASSARIQ
jgi:two-component system response regulator AtoC